MKIEAIELRRIAMPLVRPFRTSFGTQLGRDVLLVRALTTDGEGWAECVAGTDPIYSEEYVDAAHDVMVRHLVPRLLAAQPMATGVATALDAVKGHRMAKAALELAVLDAELRATGTSLASWLDATATRVPAGVSIGIAPSIPELLDEVAGYLEEGYVRVKLKIEPGWDLDPLAAVRGRFGDDLALQADANCAYERADGRHLTRLDAFDLLLIEQPFDEEDLMGHAELATHLRTPLCLDETITSLRVATDAIALGACQIVNIKLGRVGGIVEAKRIHDHCLARDVPVWCGGMLETGVGRAANVALAALPGFTLPGDISASDRYYRRDIVTAPFALDGGHIAVPSGAGTGVEVDLAFLDEVTTATEVLS